MLMILCIILFKISWKKLALYAPNLMHYSQNYSHNSDVESTFYLREVMLAALRWQSSNNPHTCILKIYNKGRKALMCEALQPSLYACLLPIIIIITAICKPLYRMW